ncbi:hypothetical protein D9623_12040 [Azospirillum brasilense]|uniref:Uncharacterized protein n=1 Tax=Azospirillum brasilense TaxID=192 RepID=A0A0P0ENN7_AZOBR|nr:MULTISPECIES: hypothetical protein [Azospirillum]ALJ35874.1 hypothetical protein AMK58_10855 [Azospirillum brasilense]MDW7552277.1 hypothetical protein [Azospirillum brasilense]MDW7593826.1 hypothetical protein [Azospirillum brasilense]MDW7628773.1 hypothetical protein [Azospirillum brasilense]MDX5954649.1 hypothetical protein [Azospirillum brasilense]
MPAAQAAGIVMSGHIDGTSRHKATLFPETLDGLNAPDAMVRVVDAVVGTPDLAALGFAKALLAAHPKQRPEIPSRLAGAN